MSLASCVAVSDLYTISELSGGWQAMYRWQAVYRWRSGWSLASYVVVGELCGRWRAVWQVASCVAVFGVWVNPWSWRQSFELFIAYSFALFFSSTHLTPDTLSNMSSQMKEPRRSERGREKTPQNPSAQQLFNQIRRWIIEHRESQSLTFENVEPEAGSLIVDSLNEDGEVERLRPRYYLSTVIHLSLH